MQLAMSYPFSKGTVNVNLVVVAEEMIGDENDGFMMDDMLKEAVQAVTSPLIPSLNHLDLKYELAEGSTVVETLYVQELLGYRVELRVEVTLELEITPKLVQAVVASSVMNNFAGYAVDVAASRAYRSLEDDMSIVPKMNVDSPLARLLGGDGGGFDMLLGDDLSPTP